MDPAQFQTESWPHALVLVVFLLVVVGLPSVLSWLGNREVKKVRTTLQENNGGSSVRDSLDRIEGTLSLMEDRLAAVEKAQTKKTGFGRWLH